MPRSARPVSVLLVGAGDRGSVYAELVRALANEARIVAIAEPRTERRRRLAQAHGIPEARCYADWREPLRERRLADAAIIATPDQEHAAPAVALAHAGYHLLLEKPLAPTPEDCHRVVAAARSAGIVFAVAHVLRYTPHTEKLKLLVEQNAIGRLVGVQRLEPVGWWHFAHSYVRGNWRRESESSPVLLAKCCHDLDWLQYFVGDRCMRVASLATRTHFRPERRPRGATDRCLDCPLESSCAYSATTLYLGQLGRGEQGWPVSVLAAEPTDESVRKALRTGPYGRCVFDCDNDVPDQQVVILEYAEGQLATLTMSAFSPAAHRQTVLMGTEGWLRGDGSQIEYVDFRSGRHQRIDVPGATARHGGGDEALLAAFLRAVARQDSSELKASPEETLYSHDLVFAAERARREGTVITLPDPSEGGARAQPPP